MVFDEALLLVDLQVAERERITRILTLDSHFSVYRLPRRARFAVLP